MNENKKIEKLVGDAMEKYRVSPPANLRESVREKLIEQKLLKKKTWRKNGYAFLLLTLFIAVVGSVGFLVNRKYTADGNDLQEKENSIKTGNEQKEISEERLTSEKKENSGLNPGEIKEKRARTDVAKSANRSSIIESSADAVKKTPKNNLAYSPSNKSSKAKSFSPVSDTSIGGKMRSNHSATDINHNQTLNKSTAEEGIDKKEEEVVDDNANTHGEVTQKPEQPPVNSMKENASTEETSARSTSLHDSLKPAENSENKLNENTVQKTDSVIVSDSAAAKNHVADTTIKNKPASHRLSLDVSGGIQFSSLLFEMNGSGSSSLFDQVKSSEKTKAALTGGIGINLLVNRFLFQTGIGMSSLKTDASLPESSFSVDTSGHYDYEDSTIMYFDTATWDTVYITFHIDSTWVTETDTSVIASLRQASNNISYIEIPFLIGYQFPFGKFSVEFKAGASIALLNKLNTTILSPVDGSNIHYKSKANSPYRNSYWNILASVNMNYSLGKKYSVFLQPAAKYGLSSIFKNDYPISKKIRSYSISAGLRIQF